MLQPYCGTLMNKRSGNENLGKKINSRMLANNVKPEIL